MPLELITLLASTVISAVLRILAQRQENAHARHRDLLAAFGKESEERREIRESENEHFAWTRRVIALSTVFSVVVLPKVAAILVPSIPVIVGHTEWISSGLLWKSTEAMVWNVGYGIFITPLDTHLVAAVAGLYFGGSISPGFRRR